MRKLLPILIFAVFCGAANADTVLFYKGAMSLTTAGEHKTLRSVTTVYLLFDNFSQYLVVDYSSTKTSGRVYHVNPAASANYGVISMPNGKFESIFSAAAAISDNSPYGYFISSDTGLNNFTLAGVNPATAVPKTLKNGSSSASIGTGSALIGQDDILTKGSGTFILDTTLTMESIEANDTFSEAIARVTTALAAKGYVPK